MIFRPYPCPHDGLRLVADIDMLASGHSPTRFRLLLSRKSSSPYHWTSSQVLGRPGKRTHEIYGTKRVKIPRHLLFLPRCTVGEAEAERALTFRPLNTARPS